MTQPPRIREIENKIDCIRECNHLLISNIRKICESSHAPTKSDIEYLKSLFEADQQRVYDLSESLAKGKRAIEQRIKESHPHQNLDCCDKSTKSLQDYDFVEVPTITRETAHTKLYQKLCSRQYMRYLHSESEKEASRDFNKCCKHDLSELEKELERMKERLEILDRERDHKHSTIDDNNMLHCNGEHTLDKSHKGEQRKRCIIS